MPLNDIVSVTITTQSSQVTRAGFGVPMILSAGATFSERVRFYTDLAGLVADGFSTSSPEYLAASAIFAQSPRPEKLAIGRRANKPTQRWTLTPSAVNSKVYSVTVDGQIASYTSDGSATVAEITAGLKTAIDALGLAVSTTDLTTALRITASVAGAWHSVKIGDPALLSAVQDHSDPGVATDLDAIALEDSSWYGLVSLFNSSAEISAIAAWTESNKKLFIAQTQDTPVITQALGVGSDIAQTLKTAAYAWTGLIYHPDTAAFADAAWAGKELPEDPGSETWKFKTLAGVEAVSFTSTQLTNLRAKFCNFYYTLAGVNITAEGVVSANEFIDVVRGRDWLEARLQERIFGMLAAAKKVPFTDAGIALVEAEVRAQLQEAVAQGFLAASPAPTVTVPKASAVSSSDKAARLLPDVKFAGTLAGAVHKTTITGTISV